MPSGSKENATAQKGKARSSSKPTKRPTPTRPPWAETDGTCIRARSLIDAADDLETQMIHRWGAGRLRLIVPAELREKFDSQRQKYEQAITSGTLDDVEREATRMANAWRALDRAALEAGEEAHDPVVWEYAHRDGTVSALVRTWTEAVHVAASGRRVRVYTLAQIGEMLETARGERPVIGEPVEEHGIADDSGQDVLAATRDRIWSPSVWDLEPDGAE